MLTGVGYPAGYDIKQDGRAERPEGRSGIVSALIGERGATGVP